MSDYAIVLILVGLVSFICLWWYGGLFYDERRN
jgi:hypothetical protein